MPRLTVKVSSLLILLSGISLLVNTSPAKAQTTIDTIPFWDRTTVITWFGEPNTATYGQTFTVPETDNVLNSFTFLLRQDDPEPSPFQFFVMAWDPANQRAAGPVLFASVPLTTSDRAVMKSYTILTGSLRLISGMQYVAFINCSNLFDGEEDNTAMAGLTRDAYPGGAFVFLNNADRFDRVRLDPWTSNWLAPGGDAVFTAQFSPGGAGEVVPEPGGWTLLLCGGIGAALTRGFRRRRAYRMKRG
jgi:hypothetical protein